MAFSRPTSVTEFGRSSHAMKSTVLSICFAISTSSPMARPKPLSGPTSCFTACSFSLNAVSCWPRWS